MISVQDATERYGVSRRTLYLWATAGRLPTYKLPLDRHTYVKPAELEPLLASEAPPRGRAGGWRLKQQSEERPQEPDVQGS